MVRALLPFADAGPRHRPARLRHAPLRPSRADQLHPGPPRGDRVTGSDVAPPEFDALASLPAEIVEKYDDLGRRWEAEFARGRALYGDRLQCKKGCSDCCSQLFQITELEAMRIARHVFGLDADTRADLA